MAMKAPTMTATVENLPDSALHMSAATAVPVASATTITTTKKQIQDIQIDQFTLHVPQLHKMRSEPLREQTINTPAPKFGLSRSEDDADEYSNEELLEQRFGSVSPIPQCTRSSLSCSPNSARAQNMRLKFRKSHTCGSLFANCNCSSTAERTVINVPLATMPLQLSVSPTSAAEHSVSSSSKLTSGVYSLSTQTSSATSAQLSRDDSMSTSFDYSYSALTSVTPHDSSARAHSPSATRQANSSTFTDSANSRTIKLAQTQSQIQTNKLQVPRISSPTSAYTTDFVIPATSSSSPSSTRKGERTKPKRLFQSYSHPDTQFVFTDENKHPSRETLAQIHTPPGEATVITSRGGKVEIKQPKRASSPNIGRYQILDVAVHPDILVKVSPKHSPVSEARRVQSPSLHSRSTEQRRRLLQRSHEIESGGSTSESEYSYDTKSPSAVGPDLLRTLQRLPPKKSPPVSPVLPIRTLLPNNSENTTPPAVATSDDLNFNAAQKYFAESGILGPINTSTNLIRKTSKILQDTNVIEQIRKTSMILRANNFKQDNKPTPPPSPVLSMNSPLKTLSNINVNNVNMEATSAQLMYTPTSPKSPHTMATTCGFSPNMTTQNCLVMDDKDAHIKTLHGEIVSLKDVIKSRDSEIMKLRREIHKLKSVLQQTTNHLPIANDDLLQSPPAALANRNLLPLQSTEISSSQQQTCACCKKKLLEQVENIGVASSMGRLTPESNGSMDSSYSESFSAGNSQMTYTGAITATCALAPELIQNERVNGAQAAPSTAAADVPIDGCNGVKSKAYQITQAPVLKKQGVSGESCETSMQQSINVPIPKFDKDYSSKQLIKEAIMDNDFLKNIDASQVRELVESMYPLSVVKGEFVIREGEVGAHLYVSAEGEFEVVKNNKVLGIMGPGKAFGELAILYNCTRTASIRVLSDARLWVLDRRVFQQIMMRTGLQRIENSVNFLKSVPLLKNLSVEVLAKIADVLEVEFYPAGTYIIRQGASGDTFFLISQGSVKVTQKLSPSLEEKEIRTLQCGDYFGEQALINEDKRTANIIAMAPGVECLTLDRDSFTHLIGDLCELKEKNYGDENRALAMRFAEKKKDVFGANVKQEFPDMKLTDLEVIATLGIGGFGRVELVKAYRDNRVDTYALKCLKKRHIVDTKQEEHVFSERTIMLTCNTPFICRLYRTFRDEKYVYMLLEACMGGEIWTMLRDRGSFNENATQFIIGCVLQAFEYLHSRGIIYRDLKPENLMLDERGYVKLVDFGFAKYIGNSSKTWTFCGTPEYVAPEIILNKGHDRAVDYWALGILIHELLNGTPPFTANDPMKTYNLILKGIDMIAFPKHMSRSAVQLIKRLCRDVPAERLGYQKSGIQDIKKHKWFLGFDWDGLESQLLIPPFVRPISHATDTCYFDKFPCDSNEPPDELSGWDADF